MSSNSHTCDMIFKQTLTNVEFISIQNRWNMCNIPVFITLFIIEINFSISTEFESIFHLKSISFTQLATDIEMYRNSFVTDKHEKTDNFALINLKQIKPFCENK